MNRDQILQLTTWEGNVWYYDGIRVYYLIADYTGDPSWEKCAGKIFNATTRSITVS